MNQYRIDRLHKAKMSRNAYVNKIAEEGSRVQAPLWARIYDVLNKGINNSINDIKKQTVRGVTHPTQIPTIVNETAIEPVVNIMSGVPSAAGNLISPRDAGGNSIPRTTRQTFSDLTRIGMGALVTGAALSPAKAFLSSGGGLPGIAAFTQAQAGLTATDFAIGSVIAGANDRQQNKKFIQDRLIPQDRNWNNKPRIFTEGHLSLAQDLEDIKIRELNRAISTEPTTPKPFTSPDLFLNFNTGTKLKAPFETKADDLNKKDEAYENLHAFELSNRFPVESDEPTPPPEVATTPTPTPTPTGQKPSFLKILQDHKGWIAGAAAGGLILGITKNYMDKRKEAEDKKKQQRRLFLQSQYPILHP